MKISIIFIILTLTSFFVQSNSIESGNYYILKCDHQQCVQHNIIPIKTADNAISDKDITFILSIIAIILSVLTFYFQTYYFNIRTKMKLKTSFSKSIPILNNDFSNPEYGDVTNYIHMFNSDVKHVQLVKGYFYFPRKKINIFQRFIYKILIFIDLKFNIFKFNKHKEHETINGAIFVFGYKGIVKIAPGETFSHEFSNEHIDFFLKNDIFSFYVIDIYDNYYKFNLNQMKSEFSS